MSTLKVSKIEPVTSGGDCIVAATNIVGNKNLIINGAMQVAQRGTTADDDSYRTVDRFMLSYGNTDNHPTQAHHALTSSDTGPWEKGFRYSFHLTNGNQTSGAGAGDFLTMQTRLEGQDIANSGWDYTSATSYITLSYWIKSSIAQSFGVRLHTQYTTEYNYASETGSLSANTWTKVIHKIPGNSNLVFTNNNTFGLQLEWTAFRGTDTTADSVTNDAWAAYASGTRIRNMTSTWYTTNDATLEITGVQLEVGDVATAFEHRSYQDELLRCQRYYNRWQEGNSVYVGETSFQYNSSILITAFHFSPQMRATPSLEDADGTNYFTAFAAGSGTDFDTFSSINSMSNKGGCVNATVSGTAGEAAGIHLSNSSAYIAFSAEL